MSWASAVSRESTWTSRTFMAFVPLWLAVPGVTLEALYSFVAWDFKVLASGVWPSRNHLGEPWPASSVMAKMQANCWQTDSGHSTFGHLVTSSSCERPTTCGITTMPQNV
eukprot:6668488-Alexandrium_andersonii.AAC.1